MFGGRCLVALETAGSGREGWSSRSAFVLAAIGSAVGLGNLWRFPAEAGANGGGAFVLFYIFCVVLIGLPLLLSETLIGRHGQSSAPESARRLARESGASRHWSILASLGVLSAFLIVSFYCVVGGWVLHYVWIFTSDLFQTGLSGGAFQGRDPAQIEALWPNLAGNGGLTVALDALFLGITLFFVARGVSSGIEVMAVWLMPAFFVLLIAITVYGAFGGAFHESMAFLFSFEPHKLTGSVMLAALGQAFFSLSLGVAGMITYGGYVGRKVNLATTSVIIAAADTFVALVAGLCIFPIVFAAGLGVNAGPALMFQTLPHAFQSMPFGSLVGIFFFLMVGVAALTSSVALLEVPTSWLMEKTGLRRVPASCTIALGAMILGALSALSTNELAEFYPLNFIPLFEGQGVFDVLDGLTSKLFMPIAAIMTSVFVGWVSDRRLVNAETGLSPTLQGIWRFLVCWLCPLTLFGILAVGIFPNLFI
ncbi:sodium-dependent transporter [Altererythrobacter indicus]|uniref:Sodium-dependent transporter n=1 Tax=Altericroceibacterium indicum TaxID=374177 RepID=A0A845A7Z6_9SPHN|nr:sodium-dependent transporter [Altericroceibacterium indicum]